MSIYMHIAYFVFMSLFAICMWLLNDQLSFVKTLRNTDKVNISTLFEMYGKLQRQIYSLQLQDTNIATQLSDIEFSLELVQDRLIDEFPVPCKPKTKGKR